MLTSGSRNLAGGCRDQNTLFYTVVQPQYFSQTHTENLMMSQSSRQTQRRDASVGNYTTILANHESLTSTFGSRLFTSPPVGGEKAGKRRADGVALGGPCSHTHTHTRYRGEQQGQWLSIPHTHTVLFSVPAASSLYRSSVLRFDRPRDVYRVLSPLSLTDVSQVFAMATQ